MIFVVKFEKSIISFSQYRHRNIFILSVFFIALKFGQPLYSQCPSPTNAVCFDGTSTATFADFKNVVLNELSGDAGQSDGANDAIVEISGPPGSIIGCMVLTNTEWAVLIPPGTTIPADGVFSIGCLNGPGVDNRDGGGVGLGSPHGSPYRPNGLVAGGHGDFNTGLPIDMDVCDPANFKYYDPAASGFTLDNTGSQSPNGDGDQVMMFLPDGTPWDGYFWDSGSRGNADHVSITINGQDYTLGDNDGDGIVNNNPSAVLGGRGDGTNTTAVPVLPTDPDCPCNTPDNPGTFTVPAIGGASDNNGSGGSLWISAVDSDHVGCNSSFIRLDPSTSAGGMGGSPSHMDGEVDDVTKSEYGQNTSHGSGAGSPTDFGETTITSEGFTPGSYTPSACGDPTSQWAYTDHPTPAQPNDDPTFIFYVNQDQLCDLSSMVTFTVEVYNWQHVSDNTDTGSGIDNLQLGSLVRDPLTGNDEAWATHVISGETTTMTYTAGPFTTPGNYTFTTVWDDFTNCCGSKTVFSNECYESEPFTIYVADPLMYDCNGDGIPDSPQTPCNVSCSPGPPTAGSIDAKQFITGGTGNFKYVLNDPSMTNPPDTNDSGVFLLPADGVANLGYEIKIIDQGSCGFADLKIIIDNNCEQAPICPENFSSTINGVSGPVNVCPADSVELCFDGDKLPPGGNVTWQVDDGSGFTDIAVFTIPKSDSVSAYISQFIYDPDVSPANCNDGTRWGDPTGSGNSCPEVVEIVVSPNSDIGGWTLSDGEGILTIPNGTTVGSDGVFVLCGGPCLTAVAGLNCDLVATNAMISGGSIILGNSSDQLILSDNNGQIRSQVFYGSTSCSGAPNCIDASDLADQSQSLNAAGTAFSGNGDSYSNFGSANGLGVTSLLNGYSSTPSNKEFCTKYAVPERCPSTTLNFQAIVDPFDSGSCPVAAPDEADSASVTVSAIISCPSASLVPVVIDQCVAMNPTANVAVNLSGGSGSYMVYYSINDVSQSPITMSAPSGMIPFSGVTATEQKVQLDSIRDNGGGMCKGTVNDDEASVTIRPTPTGRIGSSTNPTGCGPCNGSITLAFTGIGPYFFDFSMNGGAGIMITTSDPNLVLTGLCPGTYDIEFLEDEGGCLGTFISNPVVLELTTSTIFTVMSDTLKICDDGSAEINLSSDFTFNPAYSSSNFYFFAVDPSSLPLDMQDPSSFAPFTISNGMISNITADKKVFALFLDPTSNCPFTGPIEIKVDPKICLLNKKVENIPTMGTWALIVLALIFSILGTLSLKEEGVIE